VHFQLNNLLLGERVVITLLLTGILEEKLQWTNYGAVMYIQLCANALRFLTSPIASFIMYFPPRSATGAHKNIPASGGKDGWLDKRKKPYSENKKDIKNKKKGGMGASNGRLPAVQHDDRVISIDIDEESSEQGQRKRRNIAQKKIDYCEESDSSEL
jgi:hypothetical protein